MTWHFIHLMLFCAAFCFLANFLPPRGDLFIICSAILQGFPHIRPFWFSFSQSLILIKSSKCFISNSLSVALVYPLAVPLLPSLWSVCPPVWPSVHASVRGRQTSRQTEGQTPICLLYSKWGLYKQPHIHTPLNCQSNWMYGACDFKWVKRRLEEMSDVLVLWRRRGLSEWLRRCQCAAPTHFNLNAIP